MELYTFKSVENEDKRMSEFVKCEECGGIGRLIINDFICVDEPTDTVICHQCKGTGELDWIEVIAGKKEIKSIVQLHNLTTEMLPINDLNIEIEHTFPFECVVDIEILHNSQEVTDLQRDGKLNVQYLGEEEEEED